MGNQQTKSYDRVNTSCALEEDPEPREPPPFHVLFLQKLEALFCPCILTSSTLRSRKFQATGLPRLSTGSIFVLEAFNPISHESGVIAKATSGLLNFFASTASSTASNATSSATASSNEANVQAATLIGLPVLVTTNLDLLLRFKMTANQNTTRGSVHLSDVHHVKAIQQQGELCFSCVDAAGKDILRFRTDSQQQRDLWVEDLSDMISLYGEEIQQTVGRSVKDLRRKERQIEIAERRRVAKQRIADYGLKGMKHSAIARASR
jgi:hypothetical protein